MERHTGSSVLPDASRESPTNPSLIGSLEPEAGAVVLPAMPAFYTRPRSEADMVDFVVGRVCDQLGVEHKLLERWGEGDRG